MSFSEGEDALLDLNLFDENHNEFSSWFDSHALSSDDFVQRWKEIYDPEMHGANTRNETPGTSKSGD